MGLCVRRVDEGCRSRHRKPQRLAAARHIHDSKAGGAETARAAVALFIDFELALAGAKLGRATPVQRLVPELEGAVVGIDRLRETEDLTRLAADVGMQAFSWIDAVPAPADHGLAVV